MGPAVPPPPAIGAPPSAAPASSAAAGNDSWKLPSPSGEPPEASWSGLHPYEGALATFETGLESVDADRWDEPTQIGQVSDEARAEEMIERGELGEALRLYQEIAVKRPNEAQLWERVADIARMLQHRSGG